MTTMTTTGGRPGKGRSMGPGMRRSKAPRRGAARLTRRGRVVATLGILLLLLLAGFSLGRVSSQAAGPQQRVLPRSVTVQAGETLWQVAGRVAPHVDPRIVVAQIERLNHLPGAAVQAGQQLVVPRAQ